MPASLLRRTLIPAVIATVLLLVVTPNPSFGATPTHVAFAYGPVKRIATYGTGTDPGSAQAAAEAACQQQGGSSDCQGVGWWTYGYASFALNASTGKWGWGTDPYQITIADSKALNWCGTNCSLIYRVGVGGSVYQFSNLSPVRGNFTIGECGPYGCDHKGLDLYAADFFSDDPAIYPVRPGRVVFRDWNCCISGRPCQPPDTTYPDTACYGYVIAVDHGGGIYSIYTHLGKDGREAYGQQVTPQRRIGTMSNSGCLVPSCGSQPHLHFAVRSGQPGLEGTNALYSEKDPVLTPWTP